MELKTCKTCGGNLKKIGNYYVCEFCGNRWEADVADDINAVQRANAWETLRNGDFEKAEALFDEIIIKQPKNYEAYWGKALSSACITYVTDLNENKKVPTCNNITEDSFAENKFVLKAVELAPESIATEYKNQAKYIDKVRIEWLEKARKEPDYDVFISYKDSDKENGIERTRDSIDAQDLYNALTEEGYKVFFSRISLRDKVSEQYEPYIYNAIKTAKVMIVFGENVGYFSSTWIKNEWTRFKNRIEKKEKHPNSLVVVYKGIDPNDLPVILKSRQCLNMQDVTFLRTLTNHIKKIIDLSKQAQGIEKITISGGKMAKKSTEIAQKTIQVREVGQGALVETSIDDEQSFSLVKTFIKAGQFNQAKTLLDDLLFNNPNDAELIFASLLISKRKTDEQSLFDSINSFSNDDYTILEKILNSAKKKYAEALIEKLYLVSKSLEDTYCERILRVVLPFNHTKRNDLINSAFSDCIDKSKFKSFNTLLASLDSRDVDKYIDLNLRFAQKSIDNPTFVMPCVKNVLSLDEGNINAYEIILTIQLKQNLSFADLKKTFETILTYSANIDVEVTKWLATLSKYNAYSKNQIAFIKQIPCYYQGDSTKLYKTLLAVADNMLKQELYDSSNYFYKLVQRYSCNSPEAYLGISLSNFKAKNINEINYLAYDVFKNNEFCKYLSLLPEEKRLSLIQNIKQKKASEETTQRLETERRNEKKLKTFFHWLCAIITVGGFFILWLAPFCNGLRTFLAEYVIGNTERSSINIMGLVAGILYVAICVFIIGFIYKESIYYSSDFVKGLMKFLIIVSFILIALVGLLLIINLTLKIFNGTFGFLVAVAVFIGGGIGIIALIGLIWDSFD